MHIRVLVVEDKLSLNQSIVNMLRKEGYTAFGVTDMISAKEIFLKEKPHCILLDIMLPQGNGYELIPFFRKNPETRIFMLTALDDDQSKRISYEFGADDYITKPFDLYELLYKLKALQRRIRTELREYQIGDITVNEDDHSLTCREKKIIIQPSQIKFLKLLYERYRENRYLNKNDAMEGFSEDVDESPRIQTLVARIRKNLSYIESQQVFIENIYGKGYKITVRAKEER